MHSRIVWFRRDLRLADNASLTAALATGGAVIAVALSDEGSALGTASRGWRRLSLLALDASLHLAGNRLVHRKGAPSDVLPLLAAECDATAVHCTRDWTPHGIAEEQAARAALAQQGVTLEVSEGQLLVTPEALLTAAATPYRVFTPYFRAWERSRHPAQALPAPSHIPAPDHLPMSDELPSAPVDAPDVTRWWTPGEAAAQARLAEFAEGPVRDYARDRDVPALRGTSELSPRLAFGELSPSQVVAAAETLGGDAAAAFVRQLAWREFAYHVLHHFPRTATDPLREEFCAFPWSDDASSFEAWKAGLTGYPLIDAGMRQLAATGWMHNRVRLACGSFLTKDLLVPWQSGEAYFRERLVDFDPAINVFNWQWVAGSGADAAPYFRIFNPLVQARRFDAEGAYVQRWVTEPAADYPAPIVDHAEARERALAAYAAIRGLRRPLP